jgi:hypothetical protein
MVLNDIDDQLFTMPEMQRADAIPRPGIAHPPVARGQDAPRQPPGVPVSRRGPRPSVRRWLPVSGSVGACSLRPPRVRPQAGVGCAGRT